MARSNALVRCRRCRGFFTRDHLESGRHFCLPPGAGYSSVSNEDIARAAAEREALGGSGRDIWPGGGLPPQESWAYGFQFAQRAMNERLAAHDQAWERRAHNGGHIARGYAESGPAAVAMPGATWAEYRRPARPATIAGDVVVPMLQAAITGAVAAAFSPVAIWPAAQLFGVEPAPRVFALGALIAFGLALGFAWLFLLRETRASLWNIEAYEARPEAAQQAQEPEEPPAVPRARVRLEIEEQPAAAGPYRLIFQELGIDPQTLRTVARAVRGGRAFSVSGLCGRGAPLSRGQFEELRDFLLDRGFLEWRDPDNRQLGVEFTGGGEVLLTQLAALQVEADPEADPD